MDNFNLNKYLYNNKLLTESYQLGNRWSSDFDYEGMIQAGLNITINDGIEALKSLSDSFEDVNYHTENRWLQRAIEELEKGNKENADAALNLFHKKLQELDLKEDKKEMNEGEDKEDQLLDIIMKYVEDPDDAEDQLDAYMDKGLDGVSNELAANLQRDKKFKELTGIKENTKESKLREFIRKEITTLLEAEEDEVLDDIEAEVDAEEGGDEDIEADVDMDMGMDNDEEFSDEVIEIQNILEEAIELSKQLGDEKLTTQIANTIVYLNRSQYTKK